MLSVTKEVQRSVLQAQVVEKVEANKLCAMLLPSQALNLGTLNSVKLFRKSLGINLRRPEQVTHNVLEKFGKLTWPMKEDLGQFPVSYHLELYNSGVAANTNIHPRALCI